MQIIDLNTNHPYKRWPIIAQEKADDPELGEGYIITFENPDQRNLYEKIFEITKCVLLIITTLGLAFLLKDFRDLFSNCFLMNLTEEAISPVSLEDHFAKCIDGAPAPRQLYLDALGELKELSENRMTEIHLNLVPEKTEGSRATADFGSGTISIEFGHPENELLCSVIYELINFKLMPQYLEVYQKVGDGEISDADAFAQAKETVEYQVSAIHRDIVNQAIKTNRWNRDIHIQGRRLPLEEDLKLQNRTGHTDHYRRQFESVRMMMEILKHMPQNEHAG